VREKWKNSKTNTFSLALAETALDNATQTWPPESSTVELIRPNQLLPCKWGGAMKFQIGAMSVGDILDRGLKILLSRLPAFYVINLLVLWPTVLVQLATPYFVTAEAGPQSPAGAIVVAVSGLAILLLTVILQPLGIAATLYIIAQDFVDKKASIGEAFNFAFRRFGILLGTSILVGLVVGVGSLFCIVPGLIFLFWYMLTGQVVVVEGLGGTRAMARSKDLTNGFRGRVAGLFFLFFIISMIFGAVVGALGYVLPAYEMVTTSTGVRSIPNYTNNTIHVVVSFLVNTLVQTYNAVCMTLLYFDLRIRKEGFDLELAAQQQSSVAS
jgi:hypothetical protein